MRTTFPIIALMSTLCFVGISTSLPSYAVSEPKAEEVKEEAPKSDEKSARERLKDKGLL